jgi:hypothetical protein
MQYNTTLVRNAIANARPHKCRPVARWVAVMDVLAVGSTTAKQLCLDHGFDPDEEVDGPICETCEP